MSKKLGTDKTHQNLCSNDINETESPENTDSSKEYVFGNAENLLLYSLGKSPTPLTRSEIEDAIGWEMEGGPSKKNSRKGKPKLRRNYVYEIEKRLFHESEFVPSKLIFALDDNFIEYNKDEYRINLSEEFKVRVTKYLARLFSTENENFYPSFEEVYLCKLEKHELIKALKILDHKSNYLRVEINISKLKNDKQKKSSKGKPKRLEGESLRLFIGSLSSALEIELNVYKKREKGRLAVRDHDIDSKIHLKNYIDKVSPINSRNKYILNLRGLLKYLSSYNNKTPYIKINKIIENLCQIDKYWKIENEVFDFHFIISDTLQETENFIPKQILVEHRVKQRFPFLSFYNQYKYFLPRNYASQILIEIALNLKDKLEILELAELKYHTTELFFTEIHNYFWESNGFSEPKIDNRELIPLPVYNILKEYQKEIRYYLSHIKEGKSRIFIKQKEDYEAYTSRRDLKEKILKYLYKNQMPAIWIKDILHPNDPDTIPVELTGPEISVVKEICESSGLKYVTNKGFFLFKQTLIDEIKKRLKSMMPLKKAKKIVFSYGISNETAIMDVIVLSGFKVLGDRDKIQKI